LKQASKHQRRAESQTIDTELVQVMPTESRSSGDDAKTCGQRDEERKQLLDAYDAARSLHQGSSKFAVHDNSTPKLMEAWKKRYSRANAEWVFYCAQSDDDLSRISSAVKGQEAIAVANAAKAGLLAAEAAMRKKQKDVAKAFHLEKGSKEKAAKRASAAKLDAEKKAAAIAKEAVEREKRQLWSLEQITQSLYGLVEDGTTGKPVVHASITAVCLFKETSVLSRPSGEFTLSEGISGPSGRACKLSIAADGFISTSFDIRILEVPMHAIYRKVAVLPQIPHPNQFRFALTYEMVVPMMSAHILVPLVNGSHFDVSNRRLTTGDKQTIFLGPGARDSSPYAVMDHHSPPPKFGPELYSIRRVNDGTYHFVVTNEAQSFTTDQDFHQSGARAYLYQGNVQLATVPIASAEGELGPTWNVFSLSCLHAVCSMQVINRFADQS